MFETIKQRQHRPALIIAGLMLVYLWFFSWPEVASIFGSLWFGLHLVSDGSASQCILALLELFCVVGGVVIWFLCVLISWAAFRKSGKKAYIFLLAYFLLPVVVEPSSRLVHYAMAKRQVQACEPFQAAGELQPNEPTTAQPFTFTRTAINLPVGPLLLLAGVWYLYRKEEGKNDEPTTEPYSR